MSYDMMDHAGWVERNIEASTSASPSRTDLKRRAERRGWYAAPKILNPFQRRVFTILGITGGGIYNAPIEWTSVHWGNRFIILNWGREVCTWDFSGLTNAVLLAHDAAIRFSIAPNMRFLRMSFHERVPKCEGMSYPEGHPTLHDAIVRHRTRFPPGHHVHFAPAAEQPAEAAE